MKLDIERVWGTATVSGGGHIIKIEDGVIHMVACDLPAAAVRLTMTDDAGVSSYVLMTILQAQELIADLKGVAYDG